MKMKKLMALFKRFTRERSPAAEPAGPFDPGPNHNRPSATILAFQPARRWPPEALDRLAEDLASPPCRPVQTNANVVKFPRYRQQYKQGLRPVTRRGS